MFLRSVINSKKVENGCRVRLESLLSTFSTFRQLLTFYCGNELTGKLMGRYFGDRKSLASEYDVSILTARTRWGDAIMEGKVGIGIFRNGCMKVETAVG